LEVKNAKEYYKLELMREIVRDIISHCTLSCDIGKNKCKW